MVLIFAADQGTEARIRAALRSAGYPASILNTLVIAKLGDLRQALIGGNAGWYFTDYTIAPKSYDVDDYLLLELLTTARPAGERLLPNGVGLNINYPAVPNPGPPVLTELSRGYNTLTLGLKHDVDFATTGNIALDVGV